MKPPYAIGSVPSLSGHAIVYRWRSLPRVRRHRASKPQGSSDWVLPWHITMDQLIFAMDRIVTIVSLTRVLVFGLVALASSLPLCGKVPRLILKKTNRLTQAVVFSRRHFLCGALLWNCSSAEREGLYIYACTKCNGNAQQNPSTAASCVTT